jgi:hypothetical protein
LLLNDFRIAAFRGLANIGLEQLAKVNLLVGGNNSGKTSVLEALAVFAAPLDIAEWSNIARTREARHLGAMGGTLSAVDAIRWLFPFWPSGGPGADAVPDLRYEMSMSATGRWRVHGLTAECIPIRGFPPVAPGRVYRGRPVETDPTVEDEGWRISAQIEPSATSDGGPDEGFAIELWPATGFWRPDRRSSVRARAVMLAPYSHRSQPMQLRRLSRLIEEGSKLQIMHLLRSFDPRISDLEIVTDRYTSSPNIAVRREGSEVVPASVMGDGFRRALMIALAMTQARDGMLLIDEIETALHVSLLDKLFPWLIRACDDYNVQLFATTHSLEAVAAILASAPQHDGDRLAAYNLSSVDGKNRAPKRFSAEMMMRTVHDRGLDIR